MHDGRTVADIVIFLVAVAVFTVTSLVIGTALVGVFR